MPDRSVTVRLRADISQYQRDLAAASAATTAFGRNAGGAGKEIDRMSGRLKLAADAALVFGPALVGGSAAAVGGVVALSAQLGSLAGGLGVTLLATKGLGDGLKALNAYQLDPTAANAEKLRHELELLGPSGEHFVRFLDSITPELQSLQFAARDGLLPGAEEGIQHLLTMLPELKSLVSSFATEVGDLMADSGEALAGPRFEAFFDYLQTDGARILDQTARTIGNLTEVVANLFVAFSPVTGDFSGGLLEFSQGLAEASRSLETNQGFQEFLDYLQTNGPRALDTLQSLANAFLQIVEAAAPLGGPVLMAIGQVADAIARIADSDLGTPIFGALAALALLNRSMAITASLTSATFGGPAVAKMKGYVAGLTEVTSAQQRAQMTATELDAANAKTSGNFAKGAGQVALVAASLSGVADSAGLANTAMLGLLGPWGAAAGLALDLKSAWDGLNDSLESNSAALASDSIADLEARIAATKKQLEDLQSTSTGEAFGKSILTGVGAGFLADAQDQMGATTGKTAELNAQLADMQARLAGLKDGSIQAWNPVKSLGDALLASADAAQKEADALRDSVDAMRAKRSEALRAKNAELNYQQAIDDARKSLKENGETVDETTNKGRNNLRSLYALADGWNQQSNAAKNATGSLKIARRNFIDTATDMGMPIGQAKRLATALFEIPPKRKTKVEADTAAALAALNAVKNFHIPDKIVQVRVQAHTNIPGAPGGHVPVSADGGTVPKTAGGYADRHLYLLADGEEVVSNRHGQADRHRSLLKAINAGRMADGGTSGGRSGGSQGMAYWSLDHAAEAAAGGLKSLKKRLEEAGKALEREKQQRDDLIQASKDFASAVGGAYSTADPFAEFSGNVWAAGAGALGQFDAALASNTVNTQAAQSALGTAAGNGLDGALYQALAQSGNLQLLMQFANLSAAEIDAREKAFAAQSAAQAGLGGTAAQQAGFTDQIKQSNQHLTQIRHQLHEVKQAVKDASKDTGDRVAAGVNGAAANGHRRGRR